MLGFFLKPANSLAVALALALLWGGVASWRITGLKGDLALLRSEKAAVEASLASKDATINDCMAAGKRMFQAAKAMDDELQQASRRAARLNDQLIEARALNRAGLEKDRAKPECQIILQSDMRACPSVTDSLRKRAADSLR